MAVAPFPGGFNDGIDVLELRRPAELGWAPEFEDVDTIVETAWRWRERHPQGYPSR